ncbi:SLOG domain-containing protein [Shewanella frigidimarina]|uniref:SLOG domain-containing protein n=1 Tax=Shewanella frigidimarina TaxID=56812 RepID=UPI003F9FDB96
MGAIFLSASIPVIGRGQYYETADPFLIQCAVREMAIATVRRHKIVWGGHPAITPMIWSICEDLGVDYTSSVVLYQSRFFEGRYPEENQRFDNVVYTDPVPGDIKGSLQLMRQQMLSREDLIGAVFIGGMDGVEVEYDIFRRFNPEAFVLPVAAPGGAALNLARDNGYFSGRELEDIDFATLFSRYLLAP